MTFEDAGDVLGMVEAPLLVPDGFKVVVASPTEEQLDPTNPASDTRSSSSASWSASSTTAGAWARLRPR